MNTAYDNQSLQSYGMRLQRESQRREPGTEGRSVAPRVRTRAPRRSA